MAWEPRFYRRAMSPAGLVGFRVVVGETDLFIHAHRDLSQDAESVVRELRGGLERYLATHPRFGESFVPVDVDESATPLVRAMASAARTCGVGPMASVAGAFAEAVARSLSASSSEVIVENGGDVFIVGDVERIVGVWTGDEAPATLGLRLPARLMPCAVATSSGTIGPSVSLGSADGATVIATSGAIADAAASVVGNRVHGTRDIEAALEAGRVIEGVQGIVVSIGGHVGAWGAVEFVPISPL